MSKPVIKPAADFQESALPQLPGKHDEIEIKANVGTLAQLSKIREELLHVFAGDPSVLTFWENNPKPFYLPRDRSKPGLIQSHAMSVYLDTRDFALFHTDVSLRLRLTPHLSNYFEWGVKGKSRGFDGPGSAIRHEDEVVSRSLYLPADLMSDPVTRDMLQPMKKRSLYYQFCTNVERSMIGIPVLTSEGKNAFFEVCFDPINYEAPDAGQNRKLGQDYMNLDVSRFYHLNQIEIEYFNPLNEDPHMAALAQDLKLDVLTLPEIDQTMNRVREIIKHIAQVQKIPLDMTDISKGHVGFEKMPNGPYSHDGMAPSPN